MWWGVVLGWLPGVRGSLFAASLGVGYAAGSGWLWVLRLLTVVRGGAGRLVVGATVVESMYCDLPSSSCTSTGGAAGVARRCLGRVLGGLRNGVVGIGGSLVSLGWQAVHLRVGRGMAVGVGEVVLVPQ